jgi:glycyl-tRNA synthetase
LIEVGTEELPSGDLVSALRQLQKGIVPLLEKGRLEHGPVEVMATPRRLTIQIASVAPRQTEEVSIVRGPPADRAFDTDGHPTKAGSGFAKSVGVEAKELKIEDLDGGRYVVAEVRQESKTAGEVLVDLIPELLGTLRFEKSMRWNSSGVSFSRPIRWLLGLHGTEVVPFAYAGLNAGRTTRLLRISEPTERSISSADEYTNILDQAGIVLDMEARRGQILDQMKVLAEEVGGYITDDTALLEEVTNLVEEPTCLRGNLHEADLDLPMQVLITVMKVHQRYFPIEKNGKLLPFFITVQNGDGENAEEVVYGNEQVVRARFADAAYFIKRDLEQPLESYLPLLGSLTFQQQLGSVLDKVNRIVSLVPELADPLGLSGDEKRTAVQAAKLSKADLATLMVIEMTSLQGEMGREYALRSGENEAVAQAIYEHYLPRYAGDLLPTERPGMVVGMADRMDSILGLFAVGLKPTGTSDPYGLRRSAIGLIQIIREHDLRVDLRQFLKLGAHHLPVKVSEEVLTDCMEFITARQQVLLLSEGEKHDIVEAILIVQGHDPAGAAKAVRELGKHVSRPDWSEILQAYSRCARITRGQDVGTQIDANLLSEAEETALHEYLQKVEAEDRTAGSVEDFFRVFEPLIPQITNFFDEVLVMDEDQAVRSNRLALLQRIVLLAEGVADFSKLEGF